MKAALVHRIRATDTVSGTMRFERSGGKPHGQYRKAARHAGDPGPCLSCGVIVAGK